MMLCPNAANHYDRAGSHDRLKMLQTVTGDRGAWSEEAHRRPTVSGKIMSKPIAVCAFCRAANQYPTQSA
jgi:hypothetical protein